MKKEFNLSKHSINWNEGDVIPGDIICYKKDKVKEFIRLLKEEFPSNNILVGTPDTIIREIIDKFSGDKLGSRVNFIELTGGKSEK